VIVAAFAGGVTGYVVARALADEGEILNLAVATTHQRRGVGRELARAALSALGASGARTVYLEVRESNTAARLLYEDLGFAVHSVRHDYYRRPVEAALVLKAAILAGLTERLAIPILWGLLGPSTRLLEGGRCEQEPQ